MRYGIVKVWVRIKSFLLGKKSHDFFVFLFFFVVSFGFWLLQTLNETFETEISVPLELKNVPENVHITTGLPSQVNITVRERGTTLLHFFRYSVQNAVEVDFDKYDAGLTNARVQVPTADVQRMIQKQLGVTSHIISMRPDTIEYYYNRGVAQLLPVKICGNIRLKLANECNLIDKSKYEFCIIVDFPFYEWNEEDKKWDFTHNPFSMPNGGLDALNNKKPDEIVACQYDFVCNGLEMASGGERNYSPVILKKAFEIAGYDEKVVESKFPSLYQAFQFGAPPHAGMAPGLDRILMLLKDEENIREMVAFPMAANGADALMGCPNEVFEQQLRETHIKIRD